MKCNDGTDMLNLGLIDGCLVMMKTPILSWTELVGSLQSIEEAEISRDSILKRVP